MIKTRTLLTFLFFLGGILISNAQTVQSYKLVKSSTVDLKEVKEKWYVNLQNMEMPSPDGRSEKARLLQLKKEMQEKYPRKTVTLVEKGNDSVPELIVSPGFEGNEYNNSVPDDNTIAINNDGILISCMNRNYIIYDTKADTLMDSGWLNDFISHLNISSSKYDPKLTYDQEEDRFILTFLIGTLHNNSRIATCFSSTSNPLDPWHVYLFTGDALDTGHWTDYPAVALSQDEFFLTGNLLIDNGSWQTSFVQSIIWQVDKFDGYNGADSLDFQIWSDIKDDTINVRNIHPVKGARTLYGPNQYFLSNKNFAPESDTVYLIEITNTMASGSAQMNVTLLSNPDHYFMSPSGRQSINTVLATNDSRMLGAVRDDNWIQYVHNSMDTNTGLASVYHGMIENINGTPTISGRILSDTTRDLGYPNIASTGINPDEKEVVIGFNYTSPTDTNGVACFYMDNDENYSNMTILKRGDAPINILNDTIDRWGDYFGIQRHFSEPCNVWMAGMYGKVGENGCWIAHVAASDTCRTPAPIETYDPPFASGSLFPNPAIDWITFDFELEEEQFLTIELFDAQGKLVRTLWEDQGKSGENRLSFNGFYLNKGLYILRIRNNDNILFTEKLIKN